MTTTIGLLHPGAMGAALGALLVRSGHTVAWAGDGRSEATRERAGQAGLQDLRTIADLGDAVEVLVSVCPPHAAVTVADQVAATGFDGIFVEANAVAPSTTRRIMDTVTAAVVVDGGVVGPPPHRPGTTRLFLAGDAEQGAADRAARRVAGLWTGTHLDVVLLDRPAPAASALKIAYAAWTKGTSALLAAVQGYAKAAGVGDDLLAEWERSQPGLGARGESSAPRLAEKAWRFRGEMDQIATAFDDAGLPDGFHRAAGEVYERLAPLRDDADRADLATVLKAVVGRMEAADGQ